MRTFRPVRFFLAAFLAFLAAAGPARASSDLRRELADVAKNIKQLLDGRNEDSIAVGQFTGPANFPTSAGPGIVQVLSEEFQKLGVQVRQRAKLGIKGEYHLSEATSDDPGDKALNVKLLAVRLKGTVEDTFGKVLTDFSFDRVIKGEATIVELMGTPVELPPQDTQRQRDRKLRETLDKPPTRLAGMRISAGKDSPYAIEILVDNAPCAPREDDGLAFVKINRGQTYAVRLINDSPHEAAVRLTIDGLSMYTFSELRQKDSPKKGEPLYTVVIVAPKSSALIKGWHRTNEASDSFLVTEYAKSAAATLSHKTNLGTITATFAAAWPENAPPPSDEPGKKRSVGSGDATGFGPRVEAKFVEVRRNLGVIRASVSVRYTR